MDIGTKKDIRYWVDISKYDLDTAFSLLKSKRYLYVLFMCQQAVEKMLKAIVILKTKKFPPRIHDLVKLANLSSLEKNDVDLEFLDKLSSYYIETRYPEEQLKLYKQISKKTAEDYYNNTKRICLWLRQQVS